MVALDFFLTSIYEYPTRVKLCNAIKINKAFYLVNLERNSPKKISP